MKYLIGIDVGTSGTKSVLLSESGKIIAQSSCEYELIQPQNGWAQQRPEDWKKAVYQTLKDLSSAVNPEDIVGIGVSGQMHGLVLLDKNNKVLCDSIIWCDQRTEKEVDEICRVIGKKKYIKLTCNAPNTSFTLSKLLWVKNNMPDIYDKIHKVLLPKDYINFCLTGNFVTDVSDASGTGYFSVKRRDWCGQILKAFNINRGWLPKVQESADAVGTLTEESAKLLRLSENTVVASGAGDQSACALGSGLLRNGDSSISLGTSGVVFSVVDKPLYDSQGRVHTFCYSVPSMWHIMGVTQACGLSVSWFKKNFADDLTYEELNDSAQKASSDGILYLPYLMGERTPYLDPNCRGAFVGLSANHRVSNLYKAVLEGVCFSLKDCKRLINDLGIDAENYFVCGGGANSLVWLKILSNIFGQNVFCSENAESGAKGAAILAATACELYADVFEAERIMNDFKKQIILFDEKEYKEYEKLYARYVKLYPALNLLNGDLK